MGGEKRILFLCNGNSCRSQMAEAWARALRGGEFDAHSAGTTAKGIDPRAAAVMAEAGVDISAQRSKTLESLGAARFDIVVTLCSGAQDNCPYYPADVKIIHHGFDDPPELAANAESESAALEIYRRVRDEIKDFIRGLEA